MHSKSRLMIIEMKLPKKNLHLFFQDTNWSRIINKGENFFDSV